MKSRKVRRAKKSRKNARRGGGRFITKKICVSGDPDTEEENKWFGNYLNDFQNNAMPTLETHKTTRPQTKFIRDYFDFGFKTKKKCYDKKEFVGKVKKFCDKYKKNDVKPTDGGYLQACYSDFFNSSTAKDMTKESFVRGDYTQDLPPREDSKAAFVRGEFTHDLPPREEPKANFPIKRGLFPKEKEAFYKRNEIGDFKYNSDEAAIDEAQVNEFLNKYPLPLG